MGTLLLLGYSPAMELTCQNNVLKIRTGEEDELAAEENRAISHPGETIRKILAAYKSPKLPDMPPLPAVWSAISLTTTSITLSRHSTFPN